MVTLNGFIDTVATTRNFWTAFLLKAMRTQKIIKFRNGVKLKTNWANYCNMRNWFASLDATSFTTQIVDGGYTIKKENGESSLFHDDFNAQPSFLGVIK